MAKITDKERLDWLAKQGMLTMHFNALGYCHFTSIWQPAFGGDSRARYSSPRKAIDAAIRAEKKEGKRG